MVEGRKGGAEVRFCTGVWSRDAPIMARSWGGTWPGRLWLTAPPLPLGASRSVDILHCSLPLSPLPLRATCRWYSLLLSATYSLLLNATLTYIATCVPLSIISRRHWKPWHSLSLVASLICQMVQLFPLVPIAILTTSIKQQFCHSSNFDSHKDVFIYNGIISILWQLSLFIRIDIRDS